jgi:hypothetical protein
MNIEGSIPRSRGAVCGVLLILLGLWGGLAPFVGPYFHFGYTPDRAWAYTTGRLYFSVIPGAAALLGGLLAVSTRNRGVGIAGGVLAALGGAWFVVGNGFVVYVLKNHTINTGISLQSARVAAPLWDYLERAALFFGLGVLILFVAALAIGRFSMLAAKDLVADEDAYYPSSTAYPGSPAYPGATAYPSSAGATYGGQPDQYPATTGSFRTVAGQFPAGQFTASQLARSEPDAAGYTDTTTSQYLPPDSGS